MAPHSHTLALILVGAILCSIFQAVQMFSPNHKNEVVEEILDTSSFKYFISKDVADIRTAQTICQEHKGDLLEVESKELFQRLVEKFQQQPGKDIGDSLWTSGTQFSNASVYNRLEWSSSHQPITFHNFKEHFDSSPEKGKLSKSLLAVRDRRSLSECDDNCGGCNPIPIPPPFVVPPCKKPVCNITKVPCEVDATNCHISQPVRCYAKQSNCTVSRGPCQVIEHPVCSVIDSGKVCVIQPLGDCEVGEPNCTIVKTGSCKAVQDDCEYDDSDACDYTIKPCKQPCSQQECTSVTPPCVTEPPSCSNKTVCEPNPDCKIEKRCRRKRGSVQMLCENIPVNCSEACETVTICAPVTTLCPPPVSSCTRPLVDCSPEICQSRVRICNPPKIKCPPVRVICEPPIIKCDPQVNCPLPEATCPQPKINCTKPKVRCPDSVVHCGPIVTTCDEAPYTCDQPKPSCKDPIISCGPPVSCNQPTPPPSPDPCPTPCPTPPNRCGKNILVKSKRESLPEVEFVEKILCIAMRKEFDYKFETESCNQQYKFICQVRK